jgi:ABC-2 type transport system permease protein
MNAFNGLAMGGTAEFHAWGGVLTLFIGGLTAFILAWYLFRWDSQNARQRGHPALALWALLPYAAWMLIV